MDSEVTSSNTAIDSVVTGRTENIPALVGFADQATFVSAHEAESQDQVVGARLGIANAVFASLRAKHAPTARHSLRVSLHCSSIAEAIGMSEQDRCQLEISALLHDVGKIGVPDKILRKPGPLDQSEFATVKRHHAEGLHILAQFCDDPLIVQTVRYAHHRFDGVTSPPGPAGDELPIGSRILSIADAYDAMTVDQVYRPAISHDRAIAELFKNVPGQFDPELVEVFAQVPPNSSGVPASSMALRWLHEFNPRLANDRWADREPDAMSSPNASRLAQMGAFHEHLIDAMQDGVVFIDASGRIISWNRGAERITGISVKATRDREWTPALLNIRDVEGNLIRHCPVAQAMQSGVPSVNRFMIAPMSNPKQEAAVNLHVIPVLTSDRRCRGITLILRDASSEQKPGRANSKPPYEGHNGSVDAGRESRRVRSSAGRVDLRTP